MVFSSGQNANANVPILSNPVESETCCNCLLYIKAFMSIFFTVPGIVTVFSIWLSENEQYSMLCTVLGTV